MVVPLRISVPSRRPVIVHRLRLRPRAAVPIQEAAALTGKFLGLFVLFTSGMNWWTYRQIRKEQEKKK